MCCSAVPNRAIDGAQGEAGPRRAEEGAAGAEEGTQAAASERHAQLCCAIL